MLSRFRPALNEINAPMEGVNPFRLTPSGRLRLNTAEAATRKILRPFVLVFLRRYPDMTVEIVSDGRLVDIVDEGFDAGIRLVDIVVEGFDAGIRLAESVALDMVAVPCSPPLRFLVVGTGRFAHVYRAYSLSHGSARTPP